MKIEDYRLLITLDETKTLRKAAEILYISQPAVTQRLKAIEHSFGVGIFIRTKKQLITTTEGAMIIEHARDMLKRERVFFDKMQAHIGEVHYFISSSYHHMIVSMICFNLFCRTYLNLYLNIWKL